MLVGKLPGLSHITFPDRLCDLLMLLYKKIPRFFFLQIFYPVAVDLFPKIVQYLDQPFIVRGLINDLMKSHVSLCHLHQIPLCRSLLKSLGSRPQLLNILFCHTGACLLNGHILKNDAHLQHII